MCMPRSERRTRPTAGTGALVWICFVYALASWPVRAAEEPSCQKERAGSACGDERENTEELAPAIEPVLSMIRDSDGNVRRQMKVEADLMVRDKGRIGIVAGETSVD